MLVLIISTFAWCKDCIREYAYVPFTTKSFLKNSIPVKLDSSGGLVRLNAKLALHAMIYISLLYLEVLKLIKWNSIHSLG